MFWVEGAIVKEYLPNCHKNLNVAYLPVIKLRRVATAHRNTEFEANILHRDIFDETIIHKKYKLLDVFPEDFPQPLDVFNYFQEYF